MPVVGTPVLIPSPLSVNVITQPITEIYGSSLNGKMRAGVAIQAQYAALYVQLISNIDSSPVDLTGYGYLTGAAPQGPQSGATPVAWLKFRFMEACGTCGVADDAEIQTVVDASDGIVSCLIPEVVTANSGVYLCEVGMFNSHNKFIFSNTVYLFVERGLFTTSMTTEPGTSGITGAPTIQEIRLSLRDHPNLNRLLDEYEFDVADICDAVTRTVTYWNMAQPPVDMAFSTNNFPWRYQWLDGISAHLLECAANHFRRSSLPHQAAGLSINDLDKEKEYLQSAQIRMERWTAWVRAKKVEFNIAAGYGTFGSPYGAGYFSNWTW